MRTPLRRLACSPPRFHQLTPSQVRSRSVLQIRTHAQKYFQKLAREEGLDAAEAAFGGQYGISDYSLLRGVLAGKAPAPRGGGRGEGGVGGDGNFPTAGSGVVDGDGGGVGAAVTEGTRSWMAPDDGDGYAGGLTAPSAGVGAGPRTVRGRTRPRSARPSAPSRLDDDSDGEYRRHHAARSGKRGSRGGGGGAVAPSPSPVVGEDWAAQADDDAARLQALMQGQHESGRRSSGRHRRPSSALTDSLHYRDDDAGDAAGLLHPASRGRSRGATRGAHRSRMISAAPAAAHGPSSRRSLDDGERRRRRCAIPSACGAAATAAARDRRSFSVSPQMPRPTSLIRTPPLPPPP